MKKINNLELSGIWQMVYTENELVVRNKVCFKSIKEIRESSLKPIAASVPGNFELDLQVAGLIEDPFFGINPLKMQNFENIHIWYYQSFVYEYSNPDLTFFRFEGIDTFSEIYINGKLLAKTDNMLIPYEIKAEGLKQGSNEIVVHILPACIESRRFELEPSSFAMKYNYDSLKVRKAAHSFGWDIMPRIVSAGIWRPVSLFEKSSDRIDNVYIYTRRIDRVHHYGEISLFYNLSVSEDSISDYKVRFSGSCGGSTFSVEHQPWHTSGKLDATVNNCQFWWPNSLGNPDLYDIKVELIRNGHILDIENLKIGIRTIVLKKTSTTDIHGNGEFVFLVNDVKLFVKGTNWVPVDAFHSRDKERLPKILPMLIDIGCNAVRCWGGNVYEDDIFYNFCDENGIIVWQDFVMGCGAYPQDADFCRSLEEEATVIVKRLRNHAAMALWAGDNECDMAYSWGGIQRNPNTNILTRNILPGVILRQDPFREYLPSSPYIDSEAYKIGSDFTPEQHIWGPRDYYKSPFYTGTLAHFASEMGYHGCNSANSIRKFISEDKTWPWQDNEQWLIHAASPELGANASYTYRIELMAKQIRELFGDIPDNLDDFSLASQISQAEAMKFFIEFFRAGKWHRTGIIWWNLIDGWPQFSDAVVDYYLEKKLAYDFIKRSQQPVCLMFSEAKNWKIDLIASNDTMDDVFVEYNVLNIEDEEQLLSGSALVPANSAVTINDLQYSMSQQRFLLIEWKFNGSTGKNHYLCGTPTFNLQEYIGWMKKARLI